MNVVNLVGRLTEDPKAYYSKDNAEEIVSVRYSLAIKRSIVEGTDYVPVVSFGVHGKFAHKWFKKGMRVGITGTIRSSVYKDKDGKTIKSLEVLATNQEFCDGKKAEMGFEDKNFNVPPAEGDVPFN